MSQQKSKSVITSEEAIANRDKLIELDGALKTHVAQTPGIVALNVGSGRAVYPGFVSIDAYVENDRRIIRMPMQDLHGRYADNTVDVIYSSHSLEHLSIRDSAKALREWFRCLKPGGFLFLSCPDLGLLCRILCCDLSDDQRQWYTRVLFGYQQDMNRPIDDVDAPFDPGQVHMSGHTIESMISALTGIGYVVRDSFLYDGYRTPSLFVKAYKPE